MDIQLRSEETGLQTVESMKKAFEIIHYDSTIWKISFTIENGERIRLVMRNSQWILESIVVEDYSK